MTPNIKCSKDSRCIKSWMNKTHTCALIWLESHSFRRPTGELRERPINELNCGQFDVTEPIDTSWWEAETHCGAVTESKRAHDVYIWAAVTHTRTQAHTHIHISAQKILDSDKLINQCYKAILFQTNTHTCTHTFQRNIILFTVTWASAVVKWY